MTPEQLGGVGKSRKIMGIIVLLIFAVCAALDGFNFYDATPAVLWAIGIVGLSLMIAGIAKDVVAISKDIIK